MVLAGSQRQAKSGFQIRDKRNVESDGDIRQGVKTKIPSMICSGSCFRASLNLIANVYTVIVNAVRYA